MTTFDGRWKRLQSTPRTNRLPDTFAVSCGRPDPLGAGWCRGQLCKVVRHGDEWRAMFQDYASGSGLYA